MATPTRKPQRGTRPETEQWLADKGAQWEFFEEFALELIDVDRSLKNQARVAAPLNPSQVEIYTEGMKRGESFPAIVIWESPIKKGSYIVIDGNHRVTSALAAGMNLPAYVLPSTTPAELARVLTFEANTRHGLPTTTAERKQHALFLIENYNRSIKEAAAELNIPVNDLERWVRGVRTDNRIRDLKIPEYLWKEVSPTMRQRLNTFQDDEVFRTAIEYAAKMRLAHDEIGDFVRDIKALGTTAEQLEFIRTLGERNRTRLAEVATGDAGTIRAKSSNFGPRRSLISTRLFIDKVYSSQMIDLLETMTPEEAKQMADDLRSVPGKIDEIIVELEKKAREGA